jgi:sirohydrochlorin ferrochelatase
VLPVSVLHSHKIDPALLEGQPAVIFEQAVQQAKADGIDELIVLPLFIGPSRAITEYLPQVFAEANPGKLQLTIKPTLYGEDGAELLEILVDHLRQAGGDSDKDTILLCDHGSPIIEVTRVRDALARDLAAELAIPPARLIACSMERREGPEYAFNEPLLATALQRAPGDVIVLMLFLLPGRHAGPDGDVATIAKEHAKPGAQVHLSPLLATHPRLLELLARRSGRPIIRKQPKAPSVVYVLVTTLCFLLALGLWSGNAGSDILGMTRGMVGVAFFVLACAVVLLRRRR